MTHSLGYARNETVFPTTTVVHFKQDVAISGMLTDRRIAFCNILNFRYKYQLMTGEENAQTSSSWAVVSEDFCAQETDGTACGISDKNGRQGL